MRRQLKLGDDQDKRKILFVVPGLGSVSTDIIRSLGTEEWLSHQRSAKLEEALSAIGLGSIKDHLLDGETPSWMGKLQQQMVTTYLWATVMTEASIRRLPQGVLLVGYSLGELACATVCGAISEEDALILILESSSVIEEMAPRVITYFCNRPEVVLREATGDQCSHEAFLESEAAHVGVCTQEFYRHATESGKSDFIISETGTEYGFHTSFIEPAKRAIIEEVTCPQTREASISWFSCAEGTMRQSINKTWFWNMIRQPIRINDLDLQLKGKQETLIIEIGPISLFRNLITLRGPLKKPESFCVVEITDMHGDRVMKDHLDRMSKRARQGWKDSQHQGEDNLDRR